MTDPPNLTAPPLSALRIDRVEVRFLRLPVVESLDAAHGATTGSHRELTVIGLHREGDSANRVGWGECAALATPGYWHETAGSSYELLRDIAAGLEGRTTLDLVGPVAIPGLDHAVAPMAAAAVEMAALDLMLKAAGRSLGGWLGSRGSVVRAGAAVGLAAVDAVVDRVDELVVEGYRRVKVKIEPDSARSAVGTVAERLGSIPGLVDFELHIDANGAYPRLDGSGATPDRSVTDLVDLARLGVGVIEQPFPVDAAESGRVLRTALGDAGLSTLVMADESASSVALAREVVEAGSADGVVVKPSRMGGLLAAREAIAAAHTAGHPVSVGGMVESALGRHSLAAVAALDGVTVTGDISPARRWLADDPWPDVEITVVDDVLHIVVPTGAGVAPAPDPATLDRYTIARDATDR